LTRCSASSRRFIAPAWSRPSFRDRTRRVKHPRAMALPLTTDQPDRALAPSERTLDRNFLLARMGSFLAFFPLGVWTAIHLWNQLAAFAGPRSWEQSVTAHSSPASAALTFTVVLVPLVWHTGWGIVRLRKTRSSTVRNVSNLRYWLQRASALGLLAFVG